MYQFRHRFGEIGPGVCPNWSQTAAIFSEEKMIGLFLDYFVGLYETHMQMQVCETVDLDDYLHLE